jgi:gluconate 5-dehydrogenase
MEAFSLTGKRALVTGGSRGIGFEIAKACAAAGADIVLIARNMDELNQAKKELEAAGRRAAVYSFDMSNVAEIESLYSRIVNEAGPVDILVNNAGATRRGPAEQVKPEDWNFVININLTSVFATCQVFARERIKAGKSGKIVNISSLMGEAVRKDNAPYAASKGGIRQLTKSLAVEWAKYNINVNAIGPGYIKTVLTEPLYNNPTFDKWVKERTPAGRWGLPGDIAWTAVFLASPASDFITGQSIYVDGGLLSMF